MAVLIPKESSLSGGFAQTVDLSAPGQQGALRNPSTYLNSSRFVKGNTIAILVSEPKAMKYMPDGEKRIAILRSLIEDRAVTISGLNGNIQAEFAETTEGHAGFKRQNFARTMRDQINPSLETPEVLNRGIHRFWADYLVWLLADPETQRAKVYTTDAWAASGNLQLLESDRSFTVLFIEPNESGTDVVNAVLCTNMMPKTSGQNEFGRQVGESKEAPMITIEFTALPDFRDGVTNLARSILEGMNKAGSVPESLSSYYEAISTDVESASESGYAATLNGVTGE